MGIEGVTGEPHQAPPTGAPHPASLPPLLFGRTDGVQWTTDIAAWCEGDEERGPRRRGLRGVGSGEVCGALVAAKWVGLRGLVEGEVRERADRKSVV